MVYRDKKMGSSTGVLTATNHAMNIVSMPTNNFTLSQNMPNFTSLMQLFDYVMSFVFP